jgi:hypothetical protein
VILDDLTTLIEGATSLEFGVTLFAAGLPDTPDACVAMIEVPGRQGMHTFGQGVPAIEHPRVRLAVRGEPNMYEDPRDIVEAIYQALVARPNETVSGGARYLTWEPIQPPYVLGKDKNDRWILGFNVEAWKEVSA